MNNQTKLSFCRTCSSFSGFILAGNLPDTNWETMSVGNRDCLHADTLLDLAYARDLVQIVHGANREGTLPLDLPLVSNQISSSGSLDSILTFQSDHTKFVINDRSER